MAFAVPFGLGTAVFVSEFCPRRTKEFLKIIIELLAAIPSVVWGFVGMTLLSQVLKSITGPERWRERAERRHRARPQ
jgi:phosphate transport system permease protein